MPVASTALVLFVTGCSTGLGLALVKVGVEKGYKVIACSRTPESVNVNGNASNLLKLKVDVTNTKSVESAFQEAIKVFGSVDIVVNNAGYGLVGEFESYTQEEMHKQMDVNFWGSVNVTKKALEIMRPKGFGRILQISSVAGYYPSPALSLYNASKFALEGFSQTVMRELDPSWNIFITVVEPGGMQTEWANKNMSWSKAHPAYTKSTPGGQWREFWKTYHGSEETDPYKAACLLLRLVNQSKPPAKFILGHDSLELIKKQHSDISKEMAQYENLSKQATRDDFDYSNVENLKAALGAN
ncbi:short chain dehydrogenase [Schizosaccharomyces japonicus yFS275]|uniref:Short chain dehydrogenase n=1 Tax=Schizosaccharomyces japonicus (strain yFS275 / FY16936) TaxID=402676 RepID=B6K1N4_SCHJY|nr:short chain dehydrogenase [Schizosaccharomyces japonicus yFS275]EEB07065.1 short chain dehydrogenase [Schizosaccharomyces japonicus yFS275]